jgi:hypothetical protein
MNALAAVMFDLNWLSRRRYPHLAGLGASDALQSMQTQFGLREGDVLAIDAAASAAQVSIVLRKAREAQASGAQTGMLWWWREGHTPLRLL